MFGLFELSNKSFLGVDLGTASIKAVELSFQNRKPSLVNYGEVRFELMKFGKKIGVESQDEQMIVYLSKLLHSMKNGVHSCFSSIPGFSGLVTLIEFPEMKKDELDQAVTYEAHRYVPTPLDEVFLNWEMVDDHKEVARSGITNKKMQVLLVAAPKKDVQRYEHIITGADLRVDALELEVFSMTRSLIGDDPGVFLIIDIGARSSNLLLVEKGIIKMNRSVGVGGNEMTATIAESMNISSQRAENLKKQGRDFLNSRESSIIFQTLEVVIAEAQRILGAYKTRNQGTKIDGIILSGGTANFQGIDSYFSKILGVNAVVGDPWNRIAMKDDVRAMIKKTGPAFAVAIGLALRGIEENKK